MAIPMSSMLGQPTTLPIWEHAIPGSITASGGNIPTLDLYPAPGDQTNKTAIVICPGGGYANLATDHEGSQVAAWLNSIGITALVLKYRLPSDATMLNKSIGPLQDAQEALRIVRRHANDWRIDPHKIGIMGFSAGGHLAATASTHFDEVVYKPADSTSARPDFSILIYPVISMDGEITHLGSRNNLLGEHPSAELIRHFSNERSVTGGTPTAFIVHSADDDVVPVQNSIAYMTALTKLRIPCELHVYQSGGHGFGLGKSKGTESTWPESCRKWLQANGLL